MPTDPTVYAIPGFLAAIGLELYLLNRRRSGRGRPYERRDALASIGMGAGSLVTMGAWALVQFGVLNFLWQYRVADLGTGAWAWVGVMVGWDFAYYWDHRISHEVRLFWASHVNHHSSRHYNLSTALRQPWTAFQLTALLAPLSLLGFRPEMIVVAGGFNLIYQFWIHTETIDRMGPLEWVLNTPSHHRVHHGSNPEYLDKNYGGILIVWDRLFGSFEAEDAPVVYGLTKNIHTYNLFRIAFHEYAALLGDIGRARTWRVALGHMFHGPGWMPAEAGAGEGATMSPVIDLGAGPVVGTIDHLVPATTGS